MDEIKSNKNYDPRMHSAEHILNQTMVRMFNRGRSFSNHIEKKKSKCDYHFDRDLSREEISELEKRVNEIIQMNLDVEEEFLSREIAKNFYQLDKLPENTCEIIRVIRIGDYDACPCSGLHVSNTKEIGKFEIISTSYEKGVLRIRFKLRN
jgi:Ser-tRNA(Ala) deacylase AlaX